MLGWDRARDRAAVPRAVLCPLPPGVRVAHALGTASLSPAIGQPPLSRRGSGCWTRRELRARLQQRLLRAGRVPWGRRGLTASGSQCTLDPDTCDPTDTLTEQAVEFCQRVGSRATRVSDIVGRRDEAVYRAIEEGIRRVNGNAAARPYHIQKWAILERDFSISGGELGRLALL